MNGLYSLALANVGTHDLLRQYNQSENMSSVNNDFIHILNDKVFENDGELNILNQLLTTIHKLSESLGLDEELHHQLSSLVLSLTKQEASTEHMEETFIKDLISFIGQFFEQKTNIPADMAIEELLAGLGKYESFNQLISEQSLDKFLSSNMGDLIPFDNNLAQIIVNDQATINEQITLNEQMAAAKHVLKEFSILMDDIDSETTLLRQSSAILKLLGQWQQLSENIRTQVIDQNLPTNKKWSQLWNDLFNRYNKRTNLLNQTAYHHDNKVTTGDIAQWLKHLSPTILTNVQSAHSSPVITHEPIQPTFQSPLEQYVIYTRVSNNNESVSDQLLNQFRQIMRASQFSPTHPTLNQLSMTLKPNNLGEMLVRFVEINGEMTVKIHVTSQATKSLLEGNIHQLKHMFSPHQVSIEKTDTGQNLPAEDETLEKDSESHQDHEDTEENKDQQLSDQESVDFHQLLNDFI